MRKTIFKILLLFFVLIQNHSKIEAQVVTTFAGSTSGTQGSTDGTSTGATFNSSFGVAVDSLGNVYVADTYNNKIRKITPSGVVTTIAGSGSQGSADGTGTAATFYNPYGIALDSLGNIYIADTNNNKIRKITPSGIVTTIAGSGTAGGADGTVTAATFNGPNALTVDGSGNIYVADTYSNKIRKITLSGVVTTLAGSGTAGRLDGTGTGATFFEPWAIVINPLGIIYVTEAASNTIRQITQAGVVTTLAGTAGFQGSADGTGTSATFFNPYGLALDSLGNIYLADGQNYKIRKITSSGIVTTIAGSGIQGNTDGTAATATFRYPSGIALDNSGNIYVADPANNNIRKVGGVSIFITDGLRNGAQKELFVLYPNPVLDELTLELPEAGILEIYNSKGVEVKREKISAGKNLISLNNLSSGLYTLYFRGTNVVQQQTVVKK